MAQYYTGIGSRRTPQDILDLMKEIAKKLAAKGLILRSGGAQGADSAFEHGVDHWYMFMQNEKVDVPKEIFYAHDFDKLSPDARMLVVNEASKWHPVWSKLSPFVRKLHARNVLQILGRELNAPSLFVICWTPDGCIHHQNRTIETGGTGTAISVASMRQIPVFNLARNEHLFRIKEGLGL